MWPSSTRSRMIMQTNQTRGTSSEALARDFLESQDYTFISSNFTRRVGEIDLIMLSPEDSAGQSTLVFVEVRYRANSDFGGALASISWKKQRKMLRVASLWLQKHATSRDCARIDVIAVQPAANSSMNNIHQASNCYKYRGHELVWVQNAVESTT